MTCQSYCPLWKSFHKEWCLQTFGIVTILQVTLISMSPVRIIRNHAFNNKVHHFKLYLKQNAEIYKSPPPPHGQTGPKNFSLSRLHDDIQTFRHSTMSANLLDEWSTQHTLQTDIHAPARIRTHDFSKQAAVDLGLRRRGHRKRSPKYYITIPFEISHMSRIFSTVFWNIYQM